MDYAGYSLGGGQPCMRKYQANETFANAGIIVLAALDGDVGPLISTTTTFANTVGVTQDTATYVTAQQTDGTSAEREVTVCIDPFAVYRILMSGGATEGTALTLIPVTTGVSNGLTVITSSVTWNSPDFDQGTIWWYDGANVGQDRTITTAAASATATVTVAFDYASVAGDNLLRCPYSRLSDVGTTLQTTTNLYQADASIAAGTGDAVKFIDFELRDKAGEGRTKSFMHFILADNALSETT